MGSPLHFGSMGTEVERLQKLLNRRLKLSPSLKEDGMWGPRTDAAVRKFQAERGLCVDGVTGKRTWAALETEVIQTKVGDKITGPYSVYGDAPWMAVAEQEIGQKEGPQASNNSRILEYHSTTTLRATSDDVPWCSAFVNWCLRRVGVVGTDSAEARSWLHWGKVSIPTVGAITVVRNIVAGQSHVAFFLSATSTHYRLLGGNQKDQVKLSAYPKAEYTVSGYRWPVGKM